MDEPTSGLDPIFRRELLEILHQLMQDGDKTIFFSTHITTDLDKIADYITFIDKGEHIFTSRRKIGSSPDVGSSIIINSAWWDKATVNDAFIIIPFENVLIFFVSGKLNDDLFFDSYYNWFR